MSKAKMDSSEPDMRPEYDFSGGVRGKYAERFSRDCTVVVLDPDVAEAFPDAVSVNDTLREVLAQRSRG
jgi:hypothetical protein